MLEHEIAHLDVTSPFFQERRSLEEARSSGGLSYDTYHEQRRAIQFKEEQRADKIALDKAEKLIEAQIPSSLKARSDVVQLYVRVPMMGMSSLFRDGVLFYGMDDFTGIAVGRHHVRIFAPRMRRWTIQGKFQRSSRK